MSKRNFLKKAFSKFLVLVLCFAFSIGMVACGNQASALSGTGTGTTAPLTVWTHDGNVEKILQKRLTGESIDYSTYYDNKQFAIGVFQNETEGSNIILTAGDKKINEYTIDFADFTAGANVLPKSAFSVYNQKYIENVPKEGIFGGGWYPDCLLPMDIAVRYKENFIDAGTHQAIYITVKPAKDQAPGVYSGTFTITADGKTYPVTAKVEVYDFMLPTEPVGEYAAGASPANLQAGELDTTLPKLEEYYNFFVDFRCSPGNVPVHGSLSYGFDAYMEEWIPQVRKYTLDERVGFINFPYATYTVDITYETEKKDANGKIVYEIDASGEYVLDASGNKIPVMEDKIESHNNIHCGVWIRMLRRLTEACFDANGDGIQEDSEFVNLFEKASTYFVYFDEFSSTPGKDLTAITTLQFVVYAATLVGEEYEALWTNNGEKDLTENQQAVIDSMLSIKHRAISTSPAPLEKSGYVKKMEFDMKDNASGSGITDWTKNYKYYDDDGNSLISFNNTKATMFIEDFTECVFVTGITNYATDEARAEYHNYADNCQLYNHEKWVYTAENPKYPNVNNHLDTSLWGIQAMGWMQADYDANGNLYWSSTLCRQYVTVSPLYVDYLQDYYQTSERYRGTNGDGYVAYIGRPYETGPLAGIRLHAIRDANEDYDLLYYLEKYYEEVAQAKGLEYNDKGFKNVLHTMTADLYDGVKMIKSTTDKTIYNARKLVADLLAMAKNVGVVVDNYEIIEDTVRFTISAPADVEVKVNNLVQTGNTVGSLVEYVVTIPMSSTEKSIKITGTKGELSQSATFNIEAVASISQAGSFGSSASVLPESINRVDVDAGKTEVITMADGENQVSAIKGTFYDYYAFDSNGTHIKIGATGDIAVDYTPIDVENTVVKLTKYAYIIASESYLATSLGNFMKGADGNYYEFSRADEDYYDKTYSKLNRYAKNGEEYVVNMDEGTYIKAKDGTYFEVDLTDLDATSTMLVAYSLVDGKFVEDSKGIYMLKEGGDVSNNDDFIRPMEGEEGKRYKLGTDRHQLQFDISSLKITEGFSLISIKVYTDKDTEITLGGQVGTQVTYAGTRYQLKAGQWNEVQIKPAALGATATRPIKLLRLRYAGVEQDATLIVGKIVVVK